MKKIKNTKAREGTEVNASIDTLIKNGQEDGYTIILAFDRDWVAQVEENLL